MALFNATDLIDILSEMISSGNYQVEITQLNNSLKISNHESCQVLSADKPNEPVSISTASKFVSFSLEETSLLLHSVSNALDYYKESLDSPKYSKEEKKIIKSTATQARNLEAKLIHTLKDFREQ